MARMEDVFDLHHRPFDERRPLVAIDETPKQLVGEVRAPVPARPGCPARYDYGCRRNGVTGGTADDLLVGGYTAYDDDEAALAAVLSAWTDTSGPYQDPVSALTTTGVGDSQAIKLTADTVSDDGARDVLTGSSGQDWVLANVSGGGVLDKLTDLSASEFATDLDFTLGP